eukprot:CAMPEP_0170524208 /NCGR_PEP_ID=MMETSP0209-20121228/9620_1 /TAXON_ID=665100 ORGANISM="Litonotus pictus, Strain P1" /NCGR_SAMPLE_ID=MMETSP0209 /ASSEMBLY_ACC=CAM_ASM_000301 /LENGTH=752 /DNA_ID=CAMNT_0010812737 /DNA_START=35 /DNA_END=2293 /DNA_ORIENTATION=-
MSFESEPKYFSILKTTVLLISMLTGIILNQFFYILMVPKNNSYCFDIYSSEFKVCNDVQICSFSDNKSSINKILYIDERFGDTMIADKDIKTEILNINKTFKIFFFKENMMFLDKNFNLFNKFDQIEDKYFAIIHITYKENYNIANYYGLLCQYGVVFTYIIIYSLIGTLIAGLLFGFLADTYGRKLVLVLSLIILFLGTLGLFLFGVIVKQSVPDYGEINDTGRYLPHYYTDMIAYNTLYKIDLEYDRLFGELNALYREQYEVNRTFMKYQFLFYLNHLFVFCGLTGTSMSSHLISLENSINTNEIYNNSYLNQGSYALGIIINYVFLTQIDELSYVFLIESVITLILLIVSMMFIKESPKFLFEYKRYREITNFFEQITDDSEKKKPYPHTTHKQKTSASNIAAPPEKAKESESARKEKEAFKDSESKMEVEVFNRNKENLKKFYVLNTDAKIRNEIANRITISPLKHSGKGPKIKACLPNFLHNTTFLDYKNFSDTVIEQLPQPNNRVHIDLETIIQFPLILCLISFNNPVLKKKKLILFSVVITNITINFLIMGMMVSSILFSREHVYSNYAYNTYNFYTGFITILSVGLFNFIYKFFGGRIILLVSYMFLFVFSLIHLTIRDSHTLHFDRNIYYLTSITRLYEGRTGSFASILYLMIFFSMGTSYVILLYSNKYTFTLTRGTFTGIYLILYIGVFFFCESLNYFFEDTMFYITVCSVVALVSSVFLDTEDDKGFCNDYRNIKVEDTQ